MSFTHTLRMFQVWQKKRIVSIHREKCLNEGEDNFDALQSDVVSLGQMLVPIFTKKVNLSCMVPHGRDPSIAFSQIQGSLEIHLGIFLAWRDSFQ